MQFDRTRIAVRERGLLEILDLSLHVTRHYAMPLLVTCAMGSLPLMIINQATLGRIMESGYRDVELYAGEEGLATAMRFLWDMTLLVVLDAPLGTMFATAYLGKAVFVDRPSLSEVLLDGLRMLPRLAWCQMLLRGVLAAWLFLWTLEPGGEFDGAVEVLLLGSLAGYAFLVRSFRPFINEIVLLERSPLRAHGSTAPAVGRRSRQLHGPSSGDLFSRSLGIALFAVLLTASVAGSGIFLAGVFFNAWTPGPWMITCGYPLCLWLVAGYLAVVRFLSYLDLRIRHEGWEVELRMRAEGARLTGPSP